MVLFSLPLPLALPSHALSSLLPVDLLLDVLEPRRDPLELPRGLCLVLVHVDGRRCRERRERQRLGGNARVDDLQVGRDRLGPLVREDARD